MKVSQLRSVAVLGSSECRSRRLFRTFGLSPTALVRKLGLRSRRHRLRLTVAHMFAFTVVHGNQHRPLALTFAYVAHCRPHKAGPNRKLRVQQARVLVVSAKCESRRGFAAQTASINRYTPGIRSPLMLLKVLRRYWGACRTF